MKKTIILIIFALIAVAVPSQAFASGYNSGHNNGGYNSGYNTGHNIGHNTGHNYSYPKLAYSAPVYTTVYTPVYNYNTVSALGVSCYSSPTSGNIGDTITWRTSAYGGTGNYNITWTGSDGLYGYGTSVFKTYDTSGTQYASVTVISGNQTITKNCDNTVLIGNYNYNYNNYNYNTSYNYNTPIYVSCYANTTYTQTGSSVYWTANASGGNGYYTYNWSGTDYLSGTGSGLSTVYYSSGTKTATVTVYSGGQSITQSCYNSISVNVNNYNNTYVNNTGNSGNIQIACYPDKLTTTVGSPVTWSVEATGATGNFTYSWSGSDSLVGNMTSVVKSYDSTGIKNATITATASNGQSATQLCGNTVTVKSVAQNYSNSNNNGNSNNNASSYNNNNRQNQNNNSNNDLSAASLFSLNNIPWGWVAILVILVLFGVILYLVYNRNKI